MQARKAWLTPDREMKMFFIYQGSYKGSSPLPSRFGDRDQQPSQVRLWLGDEPHFYNLVFESSASAAEITTAMGLFPEADVVIVPALPDSVWDSHAGQ